MNKLILLVLCFSVLPVQGFSIEKTNVKIGCVDVKSVFDSCVLAQLIMSNLQMEIQSWQASLSQKEQEIANLEKEFQVKEVIFSEREKKERQGVIANKKTALKYEVTSAQQEFLAKQSRATEYILKRIRSVIANVAKEEGFVLILDKQNVLYGAGLIDLTGEIVKKFNKAGNKNS